MRPSKQEFERALEQGEAARRAGRPRDSVPWRGESTKIAILREAYLMGWDRADRRIRGQQE